MQKIKTFLMFSHGAEEAVNLYVSVFRDGEILGSIPGPDGTPVGYAFQLHGQEFAAYDGGPHFNFAEGMSLMVNCESQEEVDHLWEALSEGGEKQQCGWLKDRFGVSWQIVPTVLLDMLGDEDRERAARVTQAMLQMGKIEIAGLQRAYDGI